VRVACCNVLSEYFLAINGVKQGRVLSLVVFCIYIDNLLVQLLKSGFGCYIGNTFVGALAYADGIVLVAPSASAMRRLLSICDDFASKYSYSFNATKSKCMVITPRTRCKVQYCEFVVQGKPMEFVSSCASWTHI